MTAELLALQTCVIHNRRNACVGLLLDVIQDARRGGEDGYSSKLLTEMLDFFVQRAHESDDPKKVAIARTVTDDLVRKLLSMDDEDTICKRLKSIAKP